MLVLLLIAAVGASVPDRYAERLELRRLPTENMLAHFTFQVETSNVNGTDFELYPWLAAELSRHYGVREWRVAMQQASWRPEWGAPPQPASSVGASVWAWIDHNNGTVDERWRHLVQTLNGMFCASLGDVLKAQTAEPRATFGSRTGTQLRYGTLSGETVCTENLTPWRKLLPCASNGLVSLLSPSRLYESLFYSMSVTARKACEGAQCSWKLSLSLAVVFDVPLKTRSADWRVDEMFGRRIAGSCGVADTSEILVYKDRSTLSLTPAPSSEMTLDGRAYAVFDVRAAAAAAAAQGGFSVAGAYAGEKIDLTKRGEGAAISVHSRLGSGEWRNAMQHVVSMRDGEEARRLRLSLVLPWFVHVRYHSIRMQCTRDGNMETVQPLLRRWTAAETRRRPAQLEWEWRMAGGQECALEMRFDKAFLRMVEYPPDANHGVYLPAAVLEVVDEERKDGEDSPLAFYSNALLVTLPVPDFSMPFNVICFVATAVSLCFGPVHEFSTKMLIPYGVLPLTPWWRRASRLLLLAVLALACYAEYNQITLSEMRRIVERQVERLNDIKM